MKKYLKKISLLAIAFALVACGGSGDTSSSGESVVTFAKENDMTSLDLRIASDGNSLEILTTTTDGLLATDADGKTIPSLAETHEVSSDQLTWTFHLRDAKWANGDEITAHDFVYSWKQTIGDPESTYGYLFGESAACIENAEDILEGNMDVDTLGVKAIDDKTLEVKLSRPVSFFDSLLTFTTFYPLNQKFVEEKGDDYATSPENYLSSGPFKITKWEKGSKVELEKNDTYWDKDKVQVDKLVFNVVAEASTAALDFEGGSTDYVKLTSDLVDKYKDSEHYETVLEGFLWYLQFNYENEFLANKNIRMALALAIDRNKLVDDVLKDGSIATEGFVPVNLATGPDGKDYRSTADSYLTPDKEKAKEYWKKGLEELGVSSINLRLMFETADPAKPAAEFMQSELQTTLEGLTIEMIAVPKKNRTDAQKSGDFDITLTRWGPDFADPSTYLTIMLSNNIFNFGKYEGEGFDEGFAAASNEVDVTKRWQMLKDLEKQLMEDVPVAPMFQIGGAALVRNSVTGLEAHAVGIPFIYKNIKKAE